ncbi:MULTISPECIES: HAD hydrolase-like protein [unclassified Microbacterium]|uniref:HAD hydrolase-like protein n=1 Tax=unclassified Microbacterium TaxID=2609290 RepID=UPI000EA87AE5|nr:MULTISPECIES: HAD hydrolase-like protein [unclassified Microbacterium]MBT2484117.1 HAD hydrolase-like protein [Microbacterium sp. ISL-108]RKN67064.1 phosphatase [Microbacterium sp. CGR2]
MPSSPYSCVLWDVDGTIVDASVGILRRLNIALPHFGHPAPTREQLIHWIGPPMFDSFQDQAGMTPDQATEAVSFYRALGKADGYTTDVATYPGVADLIHDLHSVGIPQATASSKPEIQVDALIDHFGLRPSFTTTVGATPDEATLATKTDIVAEALRRLRVLGADTSRPVLIGDRHHDVEGGNANGVPVIFVEWGFSDHHEGDDAAFRVTSVDDLRALLLA